jgi:small subunit ribosomal protein S10
MAGERIRIKIEAYDHELLDKATFDIVETAKKSGAKVAGPIPLPTRIERYTVLRSPHVNKKSREQFEARTHKRLVDLLDLTPKTIDAVGRLTMPAGISISLKEKF